MFVYQMSKLDLGRILFLPKLWSNLTFYIAKGFSRILLYSNFDFKPSVFDMQKKLNGYKTNQKLVKRCKTSKVGWLCLNTFDCSSYINCLCMTMTITAPLGNNKIIAFTKISVELLNFVLSAIIFFFYDKVPWF